MFAKAVVGCLILVAAGSDFDDSVNVRLAELEHEIRKVKEQLELNAKQDAESKALSASTKELDGMASPRMLHNEGNATEVEVAMTNYVDGKVEDIQGAMKHIWLLICGALVMFMQAGFAMVEAGCCRAKNVQNIMLKNLTDVCVGTLGWWATGWAFAYGGPYVDGILPNGFMGGEQFFSATFLTHTSDGQFEGSDNFANWFFQWTFCSAASTIVSGGVAERVNFPGYCIFSMMMTAFVYPIIVAWTWGYGWLGANNYMDFAGSGIVHMCGGVGALVGAAIAGPRTGRWENPDSFQPHSLPLVVLGTFILWFGWYGFNCGSTLELPDRATGQLAAMVAMNTTIAPATAGLVVFLLRYAQIKKYDIGGFCNGILAGLVSITAPCGNVESGSAFLIAVIGALIYESVSILMRKAKIDDPIDAFAVHGCCGMWAVLAAALFDMGAGFDQYNGWSGFSCNVDEDGACAKGAWGNGMAINIAGVAAIFAWTAFWSSLVFAPLRAHGMLRASDEVQEAGFDASKHSPAKAYVVEETMAVRSPSKAYAVEQTPKNGQGEVVM